MKKLTLPSQGMNFLITGGTGFIGSRLVRLLISDGHSVTVLTRNTQEATKKLGSKVHLIKSLESVPGETRFDVIINLAGEPINERWSAAKKKAFISSRVSTTEGVIRLLARLEVRPGVLVSGSAIGFYGSHGDDELTETSTPNREFTHELCHKWEEAASEAEELGVRVALLRTGIALGRGGGALEKLLPVFRKGLGGPLGSGRQWMSWIALDDLIDVICHIINNETLSGPLNATAPGAVTNREFTRTLGRVLSRPAFFRVPAFIVKIIFGEMGNTLLLKGQRVVPERLQKSGYIFKYPDLYGALRAALK
ncbi:MAG: TIGR01777 family oxidoreductase [Thermodesulfobacteriota bacterium]